MKSLSAWMVCKLISTVPDFIIRTDVAGEITFANEAVFSIFPDMEATNLLGRNIMSFISPKDRPRAMENTQRMFEQSLGTHEYQIDFGGRQLQCEVNGEVLRNASQQPLGMVYAIRDVTDRKRAMDQIEKSLKEKTVLLKEIHHRVKNNMNVIISLLGLQEMHIHSREQARAAFQEAKRRIYSMALVHEQLYNTESFSEIDMADYVKKLTESTLDNYETEAHVTPVFDISDVGMDITLKGSMDGIEAAGRTHSLYDIPVVYLTANVDPKTVERVKETEPFGFIYKPVQSQVLKVVIEMALYKHAMDRRHEKREALLNATLNGVGDGVISCDIEGKILHMNPESQRLSGWLLSDSLGKPVCEICPLLGPKTRRSNAGPSGRVLKSGKSARVKGHRILVSRQGRETAVNVAASPMHDESGKLMGAVLILRDVSRETRFCKNESEAERRLKRVQAVAGMGRWE